MKRERKREREKDRERDKEKFFHLYKLKYGIHHSLR